MKTNNCEYCNSEYTAERISSKYCSESCKTMAYRQRRKLEKISEIRKKEAEEIRLKKEQIAAGKAEKKRNLIEARIKEAEVLRIKNEQIAAQKAESASILEEENAQLVKNLRIEKEQRRIKEAESRMRIIAQKSKEANRYFNLQVALIGGAFVVGMKILLPLILRPYDMPGPKNGINPDSSPEKK